MHSCTASFDEMQPLRMSAFKATTPNGVGEGKIQARVSVALLNRRYRNAIL